MTTYVLYRSYCNLKLRDIAKSREQLTPMRTTMAYSQTKNCLMLDYSHSHHEIPEADKNQPQFNLYLYDLAKKERIVSILNLEPIYIQPTIDSKTKSPRALERVYAMAQESYEFSICVN